MNLSIGPTIAIILNHQVGCAAKASCVASLPELSCAERSRHPRGIRRWALTKHGKLYIYCWWVLPSYNHIGVVKCQGKFGFKWFQQWSLVDIWHPTDEHIKTTKLSFGPRWVLSRRGAKTAAPRCAAPPHGKGELLGAAQRFCPMVTSNPRYFMCGRFICVYLSLSSESQCR